MAKHNKLDDLMGALGEGANETTSEGDKRPAPTSRPPRASAPDSQGKSAKITFSLYPEDHQIIRELSAFFAGQGLSINSSLVIKAALRAVRPGSELLQAYHQARSLDKRAKSNRPEKAS